MNIAITGGSGFIGSILAKRLKDAGHTIKIIDLNPSPLYPKETIIADVTNADAMLKHLQNIDAIYHLAAEHRDDVSPISKYYDVNVGGAKNITAAATAHNINTIIFTSSVAVYPLTPQDPQNGSAENHPPEPFNNYGQSKLDSEKVFLKWANADKQTRKLVSIRLVATFGKGNRGNIYNLINQIAKRKFIMIGDGKNRKSIAYVQNVVAFLQHTLTFHEGSHLYNYADKPDLTMQQFITTIRKTLGRDQDTPSLPYALGLLGGYAFDIIAKITRKQLPISAIRVQKFCANTIVNANKAHNSGFTAPHTLEDGLKNMIETEFKD